MRTVLGVCFAVVLALPASAFAQSEQQPPATSSELAQPSSLTTSAVPATQAAVPAPSAVPRSASTDTRHRVRIPVLVWTGAVAADQTTTYLFSSRYPGVLHETNVLVRGLDRHPALLVAAGTALDAATGWAAYRLLGGHPRLASVLFYGAAVYRACLAAHNIGMMQRAQAIVSAAPGSMVR